MILCDISVCRQNYKSFLRSINHLLSDSVLLIGSHESTQDARRTSLQFPKYRSKYSCDASDEINVRDRAWFISKIFTILDYFRVKSVIIHANRIYKFRLENSIIATFSIITIYFSSLTYLRWKKWDLYVEPRCFKDKLIKKVYPCWKPIWTTPVRSSIIHCNYFSIGKNVAVAKLQVELNAGLIEELSRGMESVLKAGRSFGNGVCRAAGALARGARRILAAVPLLGFAPVAVQDTEPPTVRYWNPR